MSGPAMWHYTDEIKHLTERLAQAERERDAALAKAEAAEKSSRFWSDALDQTRARIEALADEWERNGWASQLPAQLRALLQPRKAETALDIIEAWEKRADQNDCSEVTIDMSDLGRLRKLLERTP